jgi:hypothetical protein
LRGGVNSRYFCDNQTYPSFGLFRMIVGKLFSWKLVFGKQRPMSWTKYPILNSHISYLQRAKEIFKLFLHRYPPYPGVFIDKDLKFYVKPALASGSESLRLGERDFPGTHRGLCNIPELESFDSGCAKPGLGQGFCKLIWVQDDQIDD